jgi:hypothetical protein
VDAERIQRLLLRQKIATMPELKRALGTEVDVSVFRKLRELTYRTSYSHRGKYYTLEEIARFDATGLWSFRSVWFSQFGTLLRTCEVLVNEAEAGYFSEELEATLHVAVKDALRKLASEQRIARVKVSGRFLHVSTDSTSTRQQLRARQVRMATPGDLVSFGGGARVLPDELKAAIVLFFALLDEKQRRLYAGLESLKLGHGGDQRIAELLGTGPGTVARGRRELLSQDVETDRVRRKGAGRPSSEKKRRK